MGFVGVIKLFVVYSWFTFVCVFFLYYYAWIMITLALWKFIRLFAWNFPSSSNREEREKQKQMMLAQEKMGVGQGLGPAGMAGMYLALHNIYQYSILFLSQVFVSHSRGIRDWAPEKRVVVHYCIEHKRWMVIGCCIGF